LKILIADDNAEIRNFYRTALELLGHDVVSAENGGAALWRLEYQSKDGTKFDLLITDHDMPVMNGAKLCAAARRHSYLDSMPIVMISGGNAPEVAKDADLFFLKPVGLQDIKDIFSELERRGKL